ncbi:MAG: hypothetical protein HOC91_03710 [Nitrospinaceae bacterium]|jgi:hypothetical protein|nr:hypothetical protein [Nitrospinaceae bacterium]MBT3434027.1 hypothetical protein [Nitrospinaceae bacterium]MBT3820754.1 hypothetical protein [Nitrospinaceae bacterium]MBT4094372.1 hypothetical protein [Nitrospinaceae bacterium]MBT4429599.1 hypothetical protein [Nitrospinaceae bacterium]
MSFMKNVQETWKAWVPFMKGAAVGVIAGPIIALWAGWGVTTFAMQGQMRAAMVNSEASICAARALGENKDAAKLEWDARSKLAEKWAVMPGKKIGKVDSDVSYACAEKLAAS